MQVNPKIDYNQEDAGLTLENTGSQEEAKAESCDTQDEADLIKAESEQKPVTIKGSQVISSNRQAKQLRDNDRVIVASCMAAGVLSVVMIYALIVLNW